MKQGMCKSLGNKEDYRATRPYERLKRGKYGREV